MSHLDDELSSISSIYTANTLVRVSDGTQYTLTLPSGPAITLRIDIPAKYPDAPPSVLGTDTVGDVAKGEGHYIVQLVRHVLAEVYTPGAPVMYDLIEEVGQRLQALGLNASGAAEDKEQHIAPANRQASDSSPAGLAQGMTGLGDPPPWTLSEIIKEKKSVFIARAAPVNGLNQAKQYLAHLLATDKKVARATHNITAWRIRGDNGVQYQDCDDDGETAAGGRVLHLLELMNVWDIMVVVTRWYGGVQLGPDRFRIINQTARDALVRAGMASYAGKSSAKKKARSKDCTPQVVQCLLIEIQA